MKLWEIALPTKAHDGTSYEQALISFEADALLMAGGFTARPDGRGLWRDPKSGTIYEDVMRPYQIACDSGTFNELVSLAFRLFPDQIAIYTASIGEVEIYDRPAKPGLHIVR